MPLLGSDNKDAIHISRPNTRSGPRLRRSRRRALLRSGHTKLGNDQVAGPLIDTVLTGSVDGVFCPAPVSCRNRGLSQPGSRTNAKAISVYSANNPESLSTASLMSNRSSANRRLLADMRATNSGLSNR